MEDTTPLPTPAAPPTVPTAPIAEPGRAVWPVILGVIMMVFGFGGVLMNAWGAVSPFLMEWMIGWMDAAAMEQMRRSMLVNSGVAAVSLLVSALLGVAGIGMATRRPWAVPAARWWAVVRIVVAAAGLAAMFATQGAEVVGIDGSALEPFETTYVVAMLVFGLAWAWALPIAVLLWLRLGFVREEVATWRGSAA